MWRLSIALACVAIWYATTRSSERSVTDDEDATITPGSGAFFDTIAPTYDRLNRLISLGWHTIWRDALLSHVSFAHSILDVSTGTGDLALHLVQQNASRVVVGLDPSTRMLELARDKRKTLGISSEHLQLVEGVAEQLAFESSTFDAVVVSFGVRNFQNRSQGLLEMCRVLKPDGVIAILELSLPDTGGLRPILTLSSAFVKLVMPLIGGLVSGNLNAYQYLASSMHAFPAKQRFESMLRHAGLDVVHYERLAPFGAGPDLYVASKAKAAPAHTS